MNKRAFLIFMRSVSKFARFPVAMYFFHAYESSCFENSVGHYLFFERSCARNFKYFYTIAGIGRFGSSGETILYRDVLTRIPRKFRGLHCVRIYRSTCTAIPVGFSAVNSVS